MKTCFVVCPIGQDNSTERKRSDTVLKHIINPVCEPLGFEVIRVDNINDVDRIDNTILEYLEQSELVIADLTDHNPNVFYELGYRQALNKPTIPIMKEGTTIPFDISSVRTISYVTDDLDKVEEVKNRISKTITALNIQENKDSQDITSTNKTNVNLMPYLLNIEDSIKDLHELVSSKNDELIEKMFNLSVKQARENSSPESQALNTFLTTIMQEPDKFDEFLNIVDKVKNTK